MDSANTLGFEVIGSYSFSKKDLNWTNLNVCLNLNIFKSLIGMHDGLVMDV